MEKQGWILLLLLILTAGAVGGPGEQDQSTAILQAARAGDAHAQGVLAGVYRR
ncbi:MAG: hypothetical protein ISR91_02215, partial [Candidatus Delongbacteria bacterium]|nr:hypothetical protein [Candidatus Delongbacteria bacterium]